MPQKTQNKGLCERNEHLDKWSAVDENWFYDQEKNKVFCLKTASQNEILSLLVFFFMLLLSISNKSQGRLNHSFFLIFFYSIRHESSFSLFSHINYLYFSVLGWWVKHISAKYILKLSRLVVIQSYFLWFG